MQESGEMYLETILILSKESGAVRSVDIAAHMGFSKASVSRAMGRLREEGCVLFDAGAHVTLTEKGRRIAEKIYERHLLLTDLLMSLGVDEKTASDDACKIEHDISDDTFAAIKKRFGEGRHE